MEIQNNQELSSAHETPEQILKKVEFWLSFDSYGLIPEVAVDLCNECTNENVCTQICLWGRFLDKFERENFEREDGGELFCTSCCVGETEYFGTPSEELFTRFKEWIKQGEDTK